MSIVNKIEAGTAAHFTKNTGPMVPKAYRLYALTLSSNYATDTSAYKAYLYVIERLPYSTFTWIREISKNGKHHIHGILQLKYKFNYNSLMSSTTTMSSKYGPPYKFDIHLHYDELKTLKEIRKWIHYMYSENPKHYYQCSPDPDLIRVHKIPKSIIPQYQLRTYTAAIKIPGLS